MSKLKIGFAGTGGMGQAAHLRNYMLLGEECEVAAIAEYRKGVREAVARKYNIPNTYETAEEMLKQEKLDGIVASQPFGRHGIMLDMLSKAGIPIFIEKPLTHSIAVGKKILETLDKNGAKVMVGYHKRSDPATAYAMREIEELKKSSELGPMTYVRILMPAGDWVANGNRDNVWGEGDNSMPEVEWDPKPEDMDEDTFKAYNAFVNYYIHQVNLMRYLLGEDYKVTYADRSGKFLAGVSESGIGCTIEMSPYRTSIDWQESALVCFDKGYVKIELPAPLALNRPGKVEILKDAGEGADPLVSSPHLPWEHAMKKQAENFLAFVRGDRPAPCEAPEALKDLEVAREYIRLKTGK